MISYENLTKNEKLVLHIFQLWISLFIMIHRNNKLLLCEYNNALINEHSSISVGAILLCSFSPTRDSKLHPSRLRSVWPRRSGGKVAKSTKWWTTPRPQPLPNSIRLRPVWTYRDCFRKHKICTASHQTRSKHVVRM